MLLQLFPKCVLIPNMDSMILIIHMNQVGFQVLLDSSYGLMVFLVPSLIFIYAAFHSWI